MSNKQANDEILELIRLIDRYKCKLFKWYDIFLGMIPILFAILVSYVIIEPLLIFGAITDIDRILGALAFIAVVIALFSLMAQFIKEDVVRVNFKRILKLSCVEEDKKPLLKALIKIKAKNPEFDLEQIYNLNADIFTPEKLMEKLYE